MTAPDYIFSPDLYADVRLPVLEAGLLPPWCYTSREFYEREVREIFMKVWNLVGRVEQIPSPGDYIALELAGVPVIILRDENRKVRAFANTCRHRGCRLLTGEGSCDRYIKCPYHGWAYAFDGRLVGAPGMKDTLDFDLSQIALHPIRLETWEGFIFICFDAQSEGLMDYLGDFPERFAMYNFGDMVLTRRKESVVECNWKLLTENAMEGYHTGTVHGGSLGRQELILEETRGQWVTAFHESGKSIATLPGETRSLPQIDTLTGRAARGTYFVLLYPGSTMACNQDGVFFIQQSPEGTGAHACSPYLLLSGEHGRERRLRRDRGAVLPSPRHFGAGRHLDLRRAAGGPGIAVQFHQPTLIGGTARSLDRKLGARSGSRHCARKIRRLNRAFLRTPSSYLPCPRPERGLAVRERDPRQRHHGSASRYSLRCTRLDRTPDSSGRSSMPVPVRSRTPPTSFRTRTSF